MSFTVLQDDIFFIRLKSSDYKKRELSTVVVISFLAQSEAWSSKWRPVGSRLQNNVSPN